MLFDPDLEELHDSFVTELARTDRPDVHVVFWRGEAAATEASFWIECARVLPEASGCLSAGKGNFNCLRDHLHDDAILLHGEGEGPFQDMSRKVIWVWSNVQMLFRAEPEFFRGAFRSLVSDAAELTSGEGLGGFGDLRFKAQPVRPVMTGSSQAFERELENPDSFLHFTRWTQYKPAPPPQPTNLAVLRVMK